MSKYSFTYKERLKDPKDIQEVFEKAKPLKGELITTFILEKNNSQTKKACFVIPKQLHQKKAVLRNRYRRLLREAYRKKKNLLPLSGYNIVILGKRLNTKTKSIDIEKELEDVFRKYSQKNNRKLS